MDNVMSTNKKRIVLISSGGKVQIAAELFKKSAKRPNPSKDKKQNGC